MTESGVTKREVLATAVDSPTLTINREFGLYFYNSKRVLRDGGQVQHVNAESCFEPATTAWHILKVMGKVRP